MTSIRFTRAMKSGISVALSLALFLTSAGWPASRAYAQAVGAARAGESASPALVPGSIGASGSPVSSVSLGASALNPALNAAPSAFASGPSAVLSPALRPSAAASVPVPGGAAAAAPSAPAAAPASPAAPAGDALVPGGPRWVAPAGGALVPTGPRWVSPAKGGLSGWIGRKLAVWAASGADSAGRAFDGADAHDALHDRAADVAGAESARASGLAAPSETASRIIDDSSIPTPEAARRVGEIRHEHGTPPWAKVVAPLSVIAAGAVAIHFGAVGVLTLAAGLVLSVLAHEVAHLAVLKALGDHTAEHAGSHSLNPFHHVDAVKTVILPSLTLALSTAIFGFPVLIGAGKPVDADFNNLHGPLGGPRSARNAFWVAAAGPLTNFALAGLAFAAAAVLPAGGLFAGVAIGLAHMNVALGVFNLIPLPQLDGGKMLVSLLPDSAWTTWIYNPRIEKGYQGLLGRIYQGPNLVLTFLADKLGVKDQQTLNRVANGVTFAALAAFYAVAYVHFAVAVPLLFLALPCTYDYWCIREKVRSEAAVKDVMEIFSQWSAVISQIAEDRGMASEVSLFETEHAMKNALETLVDEMMAKEEFRALSDEEKIAALMAAYPDKAADFLKDKVFTEGADTKEKILELLKDSRNTPYYERLRRWFAEHEIFSRWDNPAYEGKLRDELHEADETKSQGRNGSTTLGMLALLGAGSLLVPELAHHLPALAAGGLGLLGLAGTLESGAESERTPEQLIAAEAAAKDTREWGAKLSAPEAAAPGAPAQGPAELIVTLAPGLSPAVVGKIRSDLDEMVHVSNVETRDDGRLVVSMRSTTEHYAETAREIAGLKAVDAVVAPALVRDRLLSRMSPPKIASHKKEHWSTGMVLVRFNAGVEESKIKEVLGKLGQKSLYRQGEFYALTADGAAKAAEAAKALSSDESVAAVEVHPNVEAVLQNRVVMPYPPAVSYDPAQAVLVQFQALATEEQIKAYAETRRLRVLYPQFRGGDKLALMEVPARADAEATRQMLADETLDEGSIAAEIKTFREQPGETPLAPSAAAVARAAARKAAAAAAEEAAARKPRRDVQAEWLSYLQTRKLQDGTTLNDKQVQGLAEYLKPVAKGPGESRPPVVARTEEVKRMLPIVTSPRGMRNSVILVGGAGVGKTAVAEGLAEMIEDAEHASSNDSEQFLQFQRLKGRWLVELDINKILAADDPIKILNAVLDILPRFNEPNAGRGNEVIVLMDEIQKFFLDKNGQKIANVLKGPLRDGKISVIATTTDAEYKKYIESDDAFRRRLEKIEVAEPTVDQTTRMLRAMKGWLQKIHDAFIPDQTLVAAAKLTDQFDKTSFNPDKAIKAVQDAAELSRPENLRAAITLDIRETWTELCSAANEARQLLIDKGIASTLALPIEMYNKVAELVKKAETLYAEREAVADGAGTVGVDVVKRVIAQKTGIASGQLNLSEEDAARYVQMEDEVGRRVVNQGNAIGAIADAVRRNKAGLSNPNRPMGKFLLVGPTGVGKTFLAKMLAWFLFNDPDAMIRFDMSEFMEEHAAMRLTGAPPSYVGYGEGGQLTEAVRKKPYSVILFDEIEKAHPKVFDLLLQILDDGRLTDGEGRTVDFKNTVILMTSNAGMSAVDGPEFVRRIKAAKLALEASGADQTQIGAAVAKIEGEWDADIDAKVGEALLGRFRPEFLNRLDDGPAPAGAAADETKKVKWIRVNRLRQQDMRKIAELQMKEFKTLLADRHETDLEIDPSVIDFLAEEGYSPLYGARPMTGAIEKNIIDPLSRWILQEAASGNKKVRGGLIRVKMKDGAVVFEADMKPASTLQRAVIKDAAARTAAEVFSLIERLASGEGEEPSEGLFDRLLRAARPAASADQPKAAPAPRAFLAADAPLALPDGASVAVLSDKPATTAAIKSAVDSVQAAGWPEAAVAALATPAGQVGEGWLKQIVAFAKDRSKKAGAAAPVELVSSADGERVRLLVHLDAELSDADKAYLAAHFSGTPPASFEAAQRVVDNLNLNGGIVRNHYLLDLYRRLKDVPGSRMGYVCGASARGGKGADLWLDIRKEEPKPAEAPALPTLAAAADGPATPHQQREMAAVRGIMMRFIDQSRMAASDQDGTAIRVAAAESYARLATPADAAQARQWIADNKWAAPGSLQLTLTSKTAWAMTAALVLQRFGGTEDIALLEAMAAKLDDYTHYQVPLHNALVNALGALYAQAGLTEIRAAAVRAANLKGADDNAKDIKAAVARALGRLGYPADLDDIKNDAQGLAELTRRMGKADELRAQFYDDDRWNGMSSTVRTTVFDLLAESEPTDKTFELIAQSLMGKRAADRTTAYHAAQAWADLVARGGRTKDLAGKIDAYFKYHGIGSYEDQWAVLYAYVLTAEQAGGPELLKPLEDLMSVNPGSISSNHEQMYFSTPEAWAKTLIRTGKFAEYSAHAMGPNGAPLPSRLDQMIVDKDHPMMAAAALRAVALARDPSFKAKYSAAGETDVPQIGLGEKYGSSGSY